MDSRYQKSTAELLAVLGLDEEPMGLFYTNTKPDAGYSPKPIDLPTVEKESRGEIDWGAVFADFSCVMGHIWRARKKMSAAYFSAELFGCPGGAFWLGFNKPQVETIIRYISTGIPGITAGEKYCRSPEVLARIFEEIDPGPAPGKYCVVKPLSRFTENETPELVIFFARPESLSGLHQLAFFVTDDPEVVRSPWTAGCGGIAAWPLRYLSWRDEKAVVGGWDPSARKYYKTDELTFTVPLSMFHRMLERYPESFLTTDTWGIVQKKIERSKRAWGEAE
jgi:uncharacterized protein (DUF169 family)